MTPARRTAGHLIVRQLEAQGVERVYCVPGESYLDVLDGLYDSSITTVVCRQEGGAGFAAVAESRLTGRPGVVAVTRGPGAANSMISVHTAYQDATALVVLVGLIPDGVRGREAFQEFDLAGWFGSTAKKVLMLDDPDAAGHLIADAFHTAASGRPGPVVVGLPEELLVRMTKHDRIRPRAASHPAPAAAEIASLEAAVSAAERPLVVVGGDGWESGAGEALCAWAAARGVGVVSDFRAHDAVDHRSDVWLGALGYAASPVTKEAFDAADLHVFAGCVRGDVMTDSYTIGCAPKTTIVVNPDAQLQGHWGAVDELITATTPEFARALADAQPVDAAGAPAAEGETASAASPESWAAAYRTRYLAWRRGPETTPPGFPYVDRDAAYAAAAAELPDDVLITYGAGNYSGWALRYWPLTRPRSLAAPRNGAMGFGMPAAVAAKLACPDRTVIALAGDGCFLMNGQEFATAVHMGLDLTVIVDDNTVYGTIVAHQEREYPGRPSGTSFTNPNFAAYADAFGGKGFDVRRTDDFVPALRAALAYRGPALIHLHTDPTVRTTLPFSG